MKRVIFLFPLILSACGTLPEPFYGNPGSEGAKLAIPPAPVLMVPNASGALLDDRSAKLFAQDMAAQLADMDVPSIAGPATGQNWHLNMTAKLSGNDVVPRYQIIGPNGKLYATQAGTPVLASSWANGDPSMLAAEAATDSRPLTKALAAVNAQVQQSNPDSLENRPPRIFMGAVAGAPGDGNSALALNMSRDLPGTDGLMVAKPSEADFIVTGNVKTKPDGNGQILVELDWSILDSNHRKIGQVTQLHDLSPSDISPYWGDVAAAAASEAASGVKEVIQKAVLKKGG